MSFPLTLERIPLMPLLIDIFFGSMAMLKLGALTVMAAPSGGLSVALWRRIGAGGV